MQLVSMMGALPNVWHKRFAKLARPFNCFTQFSYFCGASKPKAFKVESSYVSFALEPYFGEYNTRLKISWKSDGMINSFC